MKKAIVNSHLCFLRNFPKFVVSLGQYLVVNVCKYSKDLRCHTGSPELGCQFPNSKDFGNISRKITVMDDGELSFVDFSDSWATEAAWGGNLFLCLYFVFLHEVLRVPIYLVLPPT